MKRKVYSCKEFIYNLLDSELKNCHVFFGPLIKYGRFGAPGKSSFNYQLFITFRFRLLERWSCNAGSPTTFVCALESKLWVMFSCET